MKDFHCRDVDLNCEFVATGEEAEDVLEETERHAEEVHHMAITPELEEKMKSLIHDQSSPWHRESIQRNS